MTDEVKEELELDGEQESSESNNVTDSLKTEDIADDNTADARKNKSNWKQLSTAKKELEKELRSEREEKAQLISELEKVKEWANSLYEEGQNKPFSVTKKEEKALEAKESKIEERLFLIENKDAKEYLDEIQGARKKFWMEYEEAWTYVKAKLPPESKTKKTFDVSTKTPTTPKDLKKVSAEDALKLSKEDQKKWRYENWGV